MAIEVAWDRDPVAQLIHDSENGYGGFGTSIYDATPDDQIRFVFQARTTITIFQQPGRSGE